MTTEPGLLGRLIAACARAPVLTVLLVGALTVWGIYALQRTPVDAIPDLSDTQVIVLTEWPGRSPDLVEDQVTYPITSALLSTPGVETVRGQSFFGLSFVYAIFEEGTDIYWARSRVMEQLASDGQALPEGVTPRMGPDASGVGWVFQYALVDRTGQHDLQELRALQDWNLRYALESVPGVAEVATLGGVVKELQVQVDPHRLRTHDVTLDQVIGTVRASNEEAGGSVVEIAGHEHMVRGRGYATGPEDYQSAPIRVGEDGIPVRLDQVAEVGFGPGLRRGLADLDGEGEVVGGIVVMRHGENAMATITGVKERLEELAPGLPDGVEVVVTYDRSELIEASIDTLRKTLIQEMIVVGLVLFFFLLHARSALVPILVMPVAVLLAFVPMLYQGLTANIMSLGGIAVAIGAMVDGSIILLENVHKRLEDWEAKGRPIPRLEATIRAMQEVGPAIFFSLVVITVSFLPVFTLEAVEGRMFRPLAYTKTWSMAFAAILAVTLTPALIALIVRGRIRKEEDNPLNRWLIALYTPVARGAVRARWFVVGVTGVLIVASVPVWLAFDWEFMPPLNEGSLLYMPTAPPGMSVTEAGNAMQSMGALLAEVPEVERVFGKMGRADTATDPAPLMMAETTILLKPRDQWRPGLTWEGLIEDLDGRVQYPGMPNLWWMPIQTRIEMLTTGVRSPVAVQVFGDDLETIEEAALAVEAVLADLTRPGPRSWLPPWSQGPPERITRSAFAERSTGGFYIDVEIDREAASRHGLRVRDVNDVVRAAIGGQQIDELIDGRARYPVTVRYAQELRDDVTALEQILVATPTGAQVPLGQVARVVHDTGPDAIRSEDGRVSGYVFIDPGEVPVGSYVAAAREAVAEQVQLPPGVRLAWTGQYQYLERVWERLLIVVPLTLFLVVLLLYFNTRSVMETLTVLLALPFSLIGAALLLWFLDYNLSVAVVVGLIALAGLDAETSVVMLLYLKLAHKKRAEEGRLQTFDDLQEAVVEGAARRIRPKLMTVLTTILALSPILWATGAGADVMKRIAAPMVGGLATSFVLELLFYPAIFAIWKGASLPATPSSAPSQGA